MRTLIISDLHLGGRLRHDVLRRPRPLQRLLAALEGVERLVLLGDVVELRQSRPQQALAVAEPVLRALGQRLSPQAEVIIVPGNHDLPLIRPWVRANLRRLSPDTRVPAGATPALERVMAWLGAARVRVHYPGVWLNPGLWATHGHYLDLHLLPTSAYGISRAAVGRDARDLGSPADYERLIRPSMGRSSSWLPQPLAELLDDGTDLLRAATMPRVRRSLLHPRLAPVTSSLLALQMRVASVPALVRVAARLGVDARYIVFGHVHRLGPLIDDQPEQWVGETGSPELFNCGSWLYEPLLVNRATPPHPYWPGGAMELQDGDPPRAVGLLDDLTAGELR